MGLHSKQGQNNPGHYALALRLCPEQRWSLVGPVLDFFFGPIVVLDSVTFHTVASFTVSLIFISDPIIH